MKPAGLQVLVFTKYKVRGTEGNKHFDLYLRAIVERRRCLRRTKAMIVDGVDHGDAVGYTRKFDAL